MARILVTGAQGFIGSALAPALIESRASVRTTSRTPRAIAGAEHCVVADLSANTDWRRALEDVDVVIHLAGPAHARFAEYELKAQITDATRALATQAEVAGVSRFIYVSSIKAAAARTACDKGVSADEAPAPEDAYGRAKLAAEHAMLAFVALRPVILRPPLIHGARAKANFRHLLQLAASPAPLPFARASNRRNLIALSSLIEAIQRVLHAPEGPSGVFHVADQPALSTGQVVAALRAGFGRRPDLFRANWLASLAPRVLGESLVVDDQGFRDAYGFAPLQTAEELLTVTARVWRGGV
jgi:nucleoside-diphosphate-sugar epimerase